MWQKLGFARDLSFFVWEASQLEERIRMLRSKEYTGTGTAFVTFDTPKSQRQCLEAWHPKTWNPIAVARNWSILRLAGLSTAPRFRHTMHLSVKRAPESSDVIWENLGYPTWNRYLRQTIAVTIATVFIVIGLTIYTFFINYYFTTYLKNYYRSSSIDSGQSDANWYVRNWPLILSAGLAGMVAAGINYVFYVVIASLSPFEKYHSTHSFEISLMRRLFFFQYLSSAASILIIIAITKVDLRVITLTPTSREQNHYVNIAAYQAISILLSGTLFDISYWFLYPIWMRFLYWMYAKSTVEPQPAYNGPPLRISEFYASWLKAQALAFTFSSFSPYIFPVTLLTFFVRYWFDKASIFYFYDRPPHMGNELTRVVEQLSAMSVIGYLIVSFVPLGSIYDFVEVEIASRSPLQILVAILVVIVAILIIMAGSAAIFGIFYALSNVQIFKLGSKTSLMSVSAIHLDSRPYAPPLVKQIFEDDDDEDSTS